MRTRLLAACVSFLSLAIAGLVPGAAAQGAPKTAKPAIRELVNRLDPRDPFDAGVGKARVVAFFSPTCSHCIANAQSLQDVVLASQPSPNVAVHVIWLPVLETDNRAAVDRAAAIFSDPRVQHYWDPKRLLNAQLLDAIQFDIQLRLYNIVLLYDRTTTWDKRLPRPGYWMQEYKGAPGPKWNAPTFATQLTKAIADQPLDTPQP